MSPEGVETFSCLQNSHYCVGIDVLLTEKINIAMCNMQKLLFWLGDLRWDTSCS